MKTEQTHVIQMHSVLVTTARSDNAMAIMEQVSHLWEAQLKPDTEAVFTEACRRRGYIRLESITLDLGTIAAADLATELPVRYREALVQELRRRLTARVSKADAVDLAAPGTTLEVLEYLLPHGVLPWWWPSQATFDPPRELGWAIRREGVAMAALARRIGRAREVRQRLVQWLDDPALGSLVRILVPGEAAFVLHYARDLDRRQQEGRVVSAGPEEFRQAKWEVILGYLLADCGSHFNRKAFLRQTLHELASRFRLDYRVLLGELATVARDVLPSGKPSVLQLLLCEIHDDDVVNDGAVSPPDAAAENIRGLRHMIDLWRAALREEPAGWSNARREELAFWRRLPAEDAQVILIVLGDAPALATHLAALTPPHEIAILQGLLRLRPRAQPGGGWLPRLAPLAWPARKAGELALAETIEALERSASALDAAPAWRKAEEWRARWSEILATRAWRLAPREGAALAFWRTMPPAVTGEILQALIARHGFEVCSGFLLSVIAPADRALLLRALMAMPRAGVDPCLSRLATTLADAASGEPTMTDESAAWDAAAPALRLLLETGVLPPATWALRWLGRHDEWLRLTLARHADVAPPTLRTWARAGRLTESLATRFSDPALSAIVDTVEPDHAGEVTRFVDLTARAHGVAPFKGVSQAVLRVSAWRVVLDYLLVERGSVFNTRAFLRHNVEALARRHEAAPEAVLERLLAIACALGLQRLQLDLRGIRQQSRGVDEAAAAGARSDHPEKPADREQEPAIRFMARVTPDRLRRSSWMRLRLLQVLLRDPGVAQRGAVAAMLPAFWQLLAGDKIDPWPELLRDATWSLPRLETLRRTQGEPALAAAVFAGDPTQIEIWCDTLRWLETSPAAATLFPGGRVVLRSRLWRALLEIWRAQGGRPIADVNEWIGEILAAAFHLPARPGNADASREDFLGALEQAGDAQAKKLKRRFPSRASRPRQAAVVRPVAAKTAADDRAVPPAASGPILVRNAGLVILAPFLPDLHARCELLAGDGFRDSVAVDYAVHLLHYLATGEEPSFEHELALNKILCGLAPETPVPPRIELRDEDRRQADGMLERIAHQWARGAKISVSGLRRSYLLRAGQLERRKAGWLLRVERRGWDILLPELDWSFPGARPAWMAQPLEVDWI